MKRDLDQKENDKNKVIKDLEVNLNETARKLESLNSEFRQLEGLKNKLEVSEREMKNQLSSAVNEVKIYKEELDNLRNQNKDLDFTKFSQEKNITEYSIRNELLTKQLEDKNMAMKNLNSLVETLKIQKVYINVISRLNTRKD
jgi:chromosome segregation ATPase